MPPAYYPHSLPMSITLISILFPTLFISTAWSAAAAAAISLPPQQQQQQQQRNQTATSFQFQQASGTGGGTGKQCTDNPSWIGTGSTSTDCVGAVQKLYESEVKTFSDVDFEFLSPRAPPRSIPSMTTPRKYTYGTCTLAIVMLNFFSDSELPGDVEGPFASRDVTSFYDIWQAAQQIGNTCVMHYGRPGWAAEGGRESVGVFLWATDSSQNQRVPQGQPTLFAPISLPGLKTNMSNAPNEILSHNALETRRQKIGI